MLYIVPNCTLFCDWGKFVFEGDAMHLKKLNVALALLIVCLVLLISATYAWISLTVAPEITGIETHIGANGSLEIALLSDETYLDPSQIKAIVGDSMVVEDAYVSNLTWGNVVDLSGEGYGLNQISMLPSRLNVTTGTDGKNVVGSSILGYPEYGLDGRFSNFFTNTVSATFRETGFFYSTESQTYGVRGIGPISGMTSQQAALAAARSKVRSYTSAALSATQSAWSSNGAAILDIYERRYAQGSDSFTAADVAVIRDTASRMYGALSYVDVALRQGIVGYAASVLDDEETFQTLRSTVENTALPLSVLVELLPTSLPSGFATWISMVDSDRLAMQSVIYACDVLRGQSFTWNQINTLLSRIITENAVYLGSYRLSSSAAFHNMTEDNPMTLSSNAGVMANVAEFVGNYSVIFKYSSGVVEVTTVSTETPYLQRVSETLDDVEAAAGDGSVSNAQLQNVYGYAVDMAFRCNSQSELLLQTAPELRVEGSQQESIQGGGSYMRFSSQQLNAEQTVTLMDAIRIGFLDNQGQLLAVAKLNTSNFTETEEGVTAPLYLYEYTANLDGSISMGERRSEDSSIVSLSGNTATVITAVVWLDGDHVDNGLAAVTTKSMAGALNLQFASSAALQSSGQPVEDIG